MTKVSAGANAEIAKIADPELRTALERLQTTLEQSPWRKEVEEFKAQAIKKLPRAVQQVFSFLPHQLAKTSIFFPMSDRELKEENRLISKIEHETGWGKVIIQGVKLAIFEEDILLALFFLLKENPADLKGEAALQTNINKLINILYGASGYSKKNEDVILRALKHFGLVSFDLIVGDWKKQGKERIKVETVRTINAILSGSRYNPETKELKIYFNPHFLAFFGESMLTTINLSFRRNLKKDGSKALLRFLEAHTNPGRMHLLTVLNAINYNVNQPMSELRRRFKSFMAELKKHGILGKKTRLSSDDVVYFDIQNPKKSLPV